jgi:hypothetical protein
MDTIDWEYILGNFNDFDYDADDAEDNYTEMIHVAIDEYVQYFDYDNKELVEKYGVFDAISLYQDNYGEFVFEKKNAYKQYASLAYIIINEGFNDKYSFDKMKQEIENDAIIEKKLANLSVCVN